MAIDIGGQWDTCIELCAKLTGAYFDKHMITEQHVKSKWRAAYAQLYNIGKVRKYLDHQRAEKLIYALVHSHTFESALIGGITQSADWVYAD